MNHWPFVDWFILYLLDLVAFKAFERASLRSPDSTDSDQRRAEMFTVLLSCEPRPAFLEKFKRDALPAYRELVEKWAAAHPMMLSCVDEVVDALILVTFRNAGKWWLRRDQSENGSWAGFVTCHLDSVVERMGDGVQIIWTGEDPESGLAPGQPLAEAAGSRLTEEQRDMVRAAVLRLPPIQQRIVRLLHGWWPARGEWPKSKIMRCLEMDSDEFDRQLAAARDQLRRELEPFFGAGDS